MKDTAGTLYVVATPLGNLGDLSARVAQCLASVGEIYAEDTRRSRIILQHLGLQKPTRSLHAHNEQSRLQAVLRVLAAGTSVALLTDAGTPVVSDPGASVVAAAHVAGYPVVPVCGPSALTAALSVAGFEVGDAGVLFLGFLPVRGKARQAALHRVVHHTGLVVLFEAPHRLAQTLVALADSEAGREVCVCREMTKIYEEIVRGSALEMAAWAHSRAPRGELTVVLGCSGQTVPAPDEAAMQAAAQKCLSAGLSPRDAATAVAAILSVSKRVVYSLIVDLTNN